MGGTRPIAADGGRSDALQPRRVRNDMQSSDANAKAQRTRSNSSTVRNDMQSSDANAKAQRTAATKKNLERHPAPDLPFYSIRCACIYTSAVTSLPTSIRRFGLSLSPFYVPPSFARLSARGVASPPSKSNPSDICMEMDIKPYASIPCAAAGAPRVLPPRFGPRGPLGFLSLFIS